jgi:hypothetical protein
MTDLTLEERLRMKEEERRRKEEEYRRWREKNLGACKDRFDYDVYDVERGVIGEGLLNVLKPGDRVAVDLNEFANPCFARKEGNEVYVDGNIPLDGDSCDCGEFYVYEIYELPLYIHGVLPKKPDAPPPPSNYNEMMAYMHQYNKLFVTAQYKGNGVLEIIGDGEKNEYDYYLATFFYDPQTDAEFNLESVEGAVWYSAYDWSGSTMYNLLDGGRLVLSGCCDEVSTLIVLALIKRGEKAKVRFSVNPLGQDEEERYEAIISATLPPEVEVIEVERKPVHEEKTKENSCCC